MAVVLSFAAVCRFETVLRDLPPATEEVIQPLLALWSRPPHGFSLELPRPYGHIWAEQKKNENSSPELRSR